MTREIFEDKRKHALDVEMDFLNRWSILSGGTFSLLIPLVQSLKGLICSYYLLVSGGIALLVSLFASLIGSFALREVIRRKAWSWPDNPDDKFYMICWHTKEWAARVALPGYIIGIILIAVFINNNLF